jgi:hypothetical protein
MNNPSKPKKRPPPPSHRPGPFHSKYSEHVLEIIEWRRKGWTWKQVVDGLAAKNCKADEGGVCRFVKRFEDGKGYGIGQRPAPEKPAAEPEIHARKEEPARHPLTKQKPSKLKIETIRHE